MKNDNAHLLPRRRSLLVSAAAYLAGPLAGIPFISACAPSAAAQAEPQTEFARRLAGLETSAGGRIGVAAIAAGGGSGLGSGLYYRAEERFPFCSTFKMLVAAAILKRGMTDDGLLQRRIAYRKEALVRHSPVTEKHIANGMTVLELCAAAIQHSDNTAVNLLLKILGGPEALTAFARSIGDDAFRLDRWEPDLNTALPGDVRDTTTPAAMAKTLKRLALGDLLAPPQRERLLDWLKGNTTGNARIRAGVPAGWIVGDKTGSGSYGTTNDIGILWPPTGTPVEPVVVAIYFTRHKKDAPTRDDVIASATRLLIETLARS